MQYTYIIYSIIAYITIIFVISLITSRLANNNSYFIGQRKSLWPLVAIGGLADCISGVTFLSLPGSININQFSYMQVLIGYIFGYLIISEILLPIYYRYKLTSIYTYLKIELGPISEKTGATLFLISRTIGSSLRIYLTVSILQFLVLDYFNIPFFVTIITVISLMLLYTYKGGIKTLVWTDAFQSLVLISGVVTVFIALIFNLQTNPLDELSKMTIFFTDASSKHFYLKQIFSGIFIAVVMTGLDQNIMQKNISCSTLSASKKNIYAFIPSLVIVTSILMFTGALMYSFATENSIVLPNESDHVLPFIAMNHLGSSVAIIFVMALIATTLSSADSVLTTLTTTFCITFSQEKRRHLIHVLFAILLFLIVFATNFLNKSFILDTILIVAGYTYGPLLSLFSFSILTKYKVKDKLVPFVLLIPPVLTYIISKFINLGYELLLVNGGLGFIFLFLIRTNLQKKK